jgi:hypothetical protein
MKTFRSSDGIWWGVVVSVPSHSSAMVVFRHPDGSTNRNDRYAWFNAHQAGANDPRSRLSPQAVLDKLDDRAIAKLFRHSMPVHVDRPRYVVS